MVLWPTDICGICGAADVYLRLIENCKLKLLKSNEISYI
jgi:hypothetical protein